ncbi:MAG: N-acetyl sugar amidotransferase [bacterium]
MRYCTHCLMPNTKPYISFDKQGVCNACIAHQRKQDALDSIDWQAREREFYELVSQIKAQHAPFYDVLVPVSGGKDSITQVHRLQQKGLRILAVNIDYGIKTEIGHYNLNLIPQNMEAHLMIYKPEQVLHNRLTRIGLEDYGDPDLMSHTLLHAYPLWIALQLKVPLVLLGENSAFEYGGDEKIANDKNITREWFNKYAANKELTAQRIGEKYNIPYDMLKYYDFPDEIETSGIQAVFCSFYFYWDSEEHLRIARQYGFRTLQGHKEGTYRNYVGIDEKINRLHQYLKVLKFGYGRATDHACEDIRNGRISREEAKNLVRQYDLEPLSAAYLDDFVSYLGYTKSTLSRILEKYRNTEIWQRDNKGEWYIPNHLQD